MVASNASTRVHTRAHGVAIQVVNNDTWWGRANQLTVGASLDAGSTDFTQFLQPAFFPYDASLRGDTVGLLPFALTRVTDAGTANRDYGVYFADVLALTEAVHLTVGDRFDHSRISVRDRSGIDPALMADRRSAVTIRAWV